MKKMLFAILPLAGCLSAKTYAQDNNTPNRFESQQIIIQKNGDQDANISVQINGEQVIINGKPLNEYKDKDITVKKKKMIIKDGDKIISEENMIADNGAGSFFSDEEKGITKKPFLGVATEDHDKGAQITQVNKGSAAEKAGLETGDIITKINEEPITNARQLTSVIGALQPGKEIDIAYIRKNKSRKTTALLGEKNEDNSKTFSFSSPDGNRKTIIIPDLNISGELSDLMNDFSKIPGMEFNIRKQKLGLKIQDTEKDEGVTVLDIEEHSACETAGIRKGDLILEINGRKIRNTEDAREELKDDAERLTYKMKIQRNGVVLDYEVRIPRKLKTMDL